METNQQPDPEKARLKRESVIKTIRRANMVLVVAAHELDESGDGRLAGSAFAEGTEPEIISLLVNSMKNQPFIATCIVAASAVFLGSKE